MANNFNKQQELMDIVNSFGCMSQYSEMVGFFTNPANTIAIQKTYDLLGLPPANRPSYHTGGPFFFGKWHDFCDWDKGMYKFYLCAQIFKNFPAPNETQANCTVIGAYVSSLEDYKVDASTEFAVDGDKIKHLTTLDAVTDIQNYYKGKYSTLNCDSYLLEENQKKVAQSQKQAQEDSAKLILNYQPQSNTAAATAGMVTDWTTYAIVGGIAIVSLTAIIALSKD